MSSLLRNPASQPEANPSFFLRTHEAWEAMYHDCATARISIDMQQYILENDIVGQSFLRLFITKAQQGIRVTLILDSVGSRGVTSSPLIDKLRQAGGQVYFFNPLRFWDIVRPQIWFPRNHSKVLVIDGVIVHIGSACLSEEMRDWRDVHARFVSLPLIQAIRGDFQALLDYVSGGMSRFIPKPSSHAPDGRFRYCISTPHLGYNPIYLELLQQIAQAKETIYLATPYLVPPRRLVKALRNAARHGVKVAVIASEGTDVSLADCVSQSYLPKFLRSGIHLYLYKKSLMHAKYIVIDDSWAMIGSSNLDYLSLWRNREANIIIRDSYIVRELKTYFEEDLQDCIKADRAYWNKIPLLHKLIGYAGRYIERIL